MSKTISSHHKMGTFYRDTQLIKQVLSGNVGAFDDLYAVHHSLIRGVVGQFNVDSDDADDLVQQTFIKAYESLKQFRGGAAFSTWLTRIALNTCTSYFRSVTSRKKWQISIEGARASVYREFEANRCEDLNETIHRKAQKMWIRKCIEALPPHYRKVMCLRYIDDLSYEEIVIALQIPEGTVKTWLFRARSHMAKELRKNPFPEYHLGKFG